MRIATLGTGGIGGHLAVHLTRNGHEAVCIARGEHLAAIRERGLTLEGPGGSDAIRPALATDDPAEAGPVDAVILGVKARALEAAAESARPLIGPDTLVVPFLNGVEAADRLAAILPPGCVGNGCAQVSVTIAAPGVIRQTGTFATYRFAERDGTESDRVRALRAALANDAVSCPDVPDIDAAVWTKFVMFAAMSGVTAAARCRVAQIREFPELAETARALMVETAALARARGVRLSPTVVDDAMRALDGMPAEMRASTAVDLEAGRPLETDAVVGALARMSREDGLDAPVARTVAALLRPYRDGA